MEGYNLFSEGELTNLLKAGDSVAFTEIYNRYWKILYGIAYNRLKDLQSSEDVVHDVLVSLWKNRENAVIENITAYLATAIKYRIFHLLKRAMKFSVEERDREKSEHLTDTGDLEDRIHYILLLELMNEEVEKLPEKCRMVF
ncbi:RNA polymerase sigma factor, partial [Pedobacter cryoconitis]